VQGRKLSHTGAGLFQQAGAEIGRSSSPARTSRYPNGGCDAATTPRSGRPATSQHGRDRRPDAEAVGPGLDPRGYATLLADGYWSVCASEVVAMRELVDTFAGAVRSRLLGSPRSAGPGRRRKRNEGGESWWESRPESCETSG
jgi:hypothetical protein